MNLLLGLKSLVEGTALQAALQACSVAILLQGCKAFCCSYWAELKVGARAMSRARIRGAPVHQNTIAGVACMVVSQWHQILIPINLSVAGIGKEHVLVKAVCGLFLAICMWMTAVNILC